MTEIDYQAIEAYALAEVAKHAPELETAALVNTEKVITAFRNNMVSDYYLKPTTGYGYSDVGRDTLDLIYAEIFKAEAALNLSAALMPWLWLCWAICALAMS